MGWRESWMTGVSGHQLRINRWPTSAGIIGGELNPNPPQVEKRSDLANQMIVWDNLFETE
jgi:hypothetical protein